MLARDEARSGGAYRRHSTQASSDFYSIIHLQKQLIVKFISPALAAKDFEHLWVYLQVLYSCPSGNCLLSFFAQWLSVDP